MTLREQRCLFTRLLARLIEHADTLPEYEVSLDQVKRDPAIAAQYAKQGKGIRASLHLLGLAADLNLYIDGIYQRTTEAHRPLGEYWKSLHPLCRWGGDFSRPDGNHYSMQWGNRQ